MKGNVKVMSIFLSNIYSWQGAVEMCYALRISEPPSIERYADKEAVRQLCSPPPKWSLDADEELAKFMADHVNKHEASLGNISRYVESIQVSSVSFLVIVLNLNFSSLHKKQTY